jgi:beta-N-acetylhexosaminidase
MTSMGAIREICGIGEATVQAASAGHDLLLVCHTASAQRRAHSALLDAYRTRALRCGRSSRAWRDSTR